MNRYNSEGYYDPTAYEALVAVEKAEKAPRQYMPLVYIASPYAGDIKRNIERARDYCRFAVSDGRIPIAPHLLYPQFMDDGDNEQRRLGQFFALILLTKCEAVWVFGDRISEGMAAEIAKAKKRGIPIKYFSCNCKEVPEHE